ncbi:TetR/AcrR family transcriptional regulator [Solimonas terrae]|uniref:TetR/AcrR family transcriptional regulator n=1 Tax=Solimonas terrae TaxID=1396819 RepID=A0A6M2BNP6_9GAMM|nr:TetR/AcrR family transcriptional regulator [Solimonas terrae]NGY03994.1 TetR/AcrR family transcriptional regulator [Solimonas terrae]
MARPSLEGKTIRQKTQPEPARPRAGRPTRAQQQQRVEELLSVALDTFLERGFDQTTIEEIATRVGMSKRTVYAYHDDKEALFRAAVRRAIEAYTVPREDIEALVGDDLEASLRAIAHQRVANLSRPVSIKLQRILAAQAYRFPELFNAAFEEGAGPVVEVLRALFARHEAAGDIAVGDAQHAAAAFLSLVVGGPTRLIVAGNALGKTELDARIDFGVRLFLRGALRR